MKTNCEICNSEFETKSNGRFCSDECKKIHAKENGIMFQSKNPKSIASRKYNAKNRDKLKMIKLSYRMRLKYEVLSHYSGKDHPVCSRCGEDDPDVLVLDHINDDGRQEREKLNIASRDSNGGVIRGQRSYEVYKKNGYPEGLQVLCANCNTKKQICKNRSEHSKNPWYNHYIAEERRLSWIRKY